MTEHMYMDRMGRYYYGTDPGNPTDDDNEDWPQTAKHRRNDFKCKYNSAENIVFAYTFL